MPGVSALKMIISFLRGTVGHGCFFLWDSPAKCGTVGRYASKRAL